MPEVDADVVRFALETAREKGFAEIELESDGVKFKACMEPAQAPVTPSPTPLAETVDVVDTGPETAEITSPCVGYFQNGSPALESGRRVEHGEIIASIQALGIANDVESGTDGEVVEVFVKEGDAVAFGQALARVLVNA